MFLNFIHGCNQAALSKLNSRNPVLEGLFIPRFILRSPPIVAGKCNLRRDFH